MRGFNSSKINYATDLLGRYDILLLQEHWLNNNELVTFNCYFPGYCVHGISALDGSKFLIRRPNVGVLTNIYLLIFKVQYPMYIKIQGQWTVHNMGCII